MSLLLLLLPATPQPLACHCCCCCCCCSMHSFITVTCRHDCTTPWDCFEAFGATRVYCPGVCWALLACTSHHGTSHTFVSLSSADLGDAVVVQCPGQRSSHGRLSQLTCQLMCP
jgi:hypothetical protein